MAKIALISPYDQYALGIRYLSSALKDAGHQTRIIILKTVHENRNPENLRIELGYSGANAACSDIEYGLLKDLLVEFEADFIGLTLASQCFGLGAWLTERFHRDFPGIPVLWGGSDPALHPELGIEHADFLATGEGEDCLLELIQLFCEGKDASHVQGFWARRGNEIIRNPGRPLIQDLDRLPFPDFDRDEKFLIQHNQCGSLDKLWYIIMTQRGCPYRCTYCINSVLPGLHEGEKYTRRRSVENTMAELRQIKAAYPEELDFIQFFDDIFTVSKRWLKEFAPLYRDEIGFPFWCYTYPGQCDDTIAELLNVMGISYVQFGIQSGSQRTLEEVYKRSDPAGVTETATILNKHKIPIRFDLIAGNPLETDDDHLQTLEVLLSCPHPYRINPTNPLTFYFNSPITDMAKQKGIALKEMEGVNGYLAEDDNHFAFWRTIFDLAQYSVLDKDFIRSLAHDEYLMEHPEILERFQMALQDSTWVDPGAFMTKQDMIDVLRGEIEALQMDLQQLQDRLNRIEGKSLYKLYKRIRPLIPSTHVGAESVQS